MLQDLHILYLDLEVNSPDSEFLLALQNSVVCVQISHLVRYLDF